MSNFEFIARPATKNERDTMDKVVETFIDHANRRLTAEAAAHLQAGYAAEELVVVEWGICTGVRRVMLGAELKLMLALGDVVDMKEQVPKFVIEVRHVYP